MLSLFAWGCHASASTSESTVRFYKANSASQAGDYDGALKLYREITDSGFVSAAVYYNIANCYMKKGELGRALVGYERALRLSPRDSDLLDVCAFDHEESGGESRAEPRTENFCPFGVCC